MTALLSDLTPGTRVRVINAGHLSGKTGTVVEMSAGLLNGHDVAVEFDDKTGWGSGPLCFYAHELAVAR